MGSHSFGLEGKTRKKRITGSLFLRMPSTSLKTCNSVLHFNYTLQLITITFYLKFTNYFTLICRTGYIGPLCVIAFFIVSTIFNKLLMSPVARRVFLQDRREGDLR